MLIALNTSPGPLGEREGAYIDRDSFMAEFTDSNMLVVLN